MTYRSLDEHQRLVEKAQQKSNQMLAKSSVQSPQVKGQRPIKYKPAHPLPCHFDQRQHPNAGFPPKRPVVHPRVRRRRHPDRPPQIPDPRRGRTSTSREPSTASRSARKAGSCTASPYRTIEPDLSGGVLPPTRAARRRGVLDYGFEPFFHRGATTTTTTTRRVFFSRAP